jgi:hypothetical protein
MAPDSFTYAQVQSALAAVYHIPANNTGWFRGRITSFQKLGIVPASPGKGRRVAYRREDVFHWAMALEFSNWGWDPNVVKTILRLNWPNIRPVLLEASGGPDTYLYFQPELLGKLAPEDQREAIGKPGAPFKVSIAIVSDLEELDKLAKTDQARVTLRRFRDEHGKINLSRIRRDVDAALAKAASPNR